MFVGMLVVGFHFFRFLLHLVDAQFYLLFTHIPSFYIRTIVREKKNVKGVVARAASQIGQRWKE